MHRLGRTRRAEALARAATVLGSLALVFGVAEAVTRAAWDPPAAMPERRIDDEDASLPRLSWFELARPGVRGLWNGVLYETNVWGFRGPVVAPDPAPRTFRIAVAGDSLAMGSGVRVEDAYPARLQEALRPAVRGRRPEVLNLGLSALNAEKVIERLASFARQLHPDLIVYGYTLNDLEGPFYEQRLDRTPQAPPAPPSFWQSHLLAFLEPRVASLREALSPPRDSYVHELNHNYLHNPAAWSWLGERFDDLRALGEELDVCVVVMIHPRLEMLHALHPFREHYRRVAELAAARGFTVVEAFAAFEGDRGPHFWVSPVDRHPNAEGHERLAGVLRRTLYELPEHCFEGSAWRREHER